ncbi:MAG: class I SAM-dependent methyltransferase [Pseudomonadota bacterium]
MTNRIRYVLEELLPPALHDTWPMRMLYRLKFGPLLDDLAEFRKRAPFLTAEEYRNIYERMPRVHEGTDNSEACIQAIIENLVPGSVCDIGCGTGYLLRQIKQRGSNLTEYTGLDFILDDEQKNTTDIKFIEAPVEVLPFPDNAFDNVVCTHVLEHILDIAGTLEELRRITRQRLIIIVPREREHVYTFNPHFHFFPYTHSFLRVARPHPERYSIRDIQRDIFYIEDMPADAAGDPS